MKNKPFITIENNPFIAVVCGEIETEKEDLMEKISAENDMDFICIINPETDSHPKKQSLSAENWARRISVKRCNVILTTNSVHYFEAFLTYLKKYGVDGNLRFYLAENENFYTSDNPQIIYKNLGQPTFDLEDV
ncbi:MAG: hypothetical protein NC489_07905 [Ruminococcus flavefaciens]|nr:hypothetical protein [Ruminococcus flavefaciens]